MKQQPEKVWSDQPHSPGDYVYIKLQWYHQLSLHKRLSDRLFPIYYGPYHILAKISHAAVKSSGH